MDTKIEDVIKGETPIQEFYKNKCIFLTGATGFFGKIIMEKLLRVTDIEHIYILVRIKRGKDVYTRLEEIFDDPVFNTIKKLKPKFQHKVSVIKGDCAMPGLGISPEERTLLTQSADIILHAAATVRFQEKLKNALAINLLGTSAIIDLCRECRKLKAVVHVSTAYSNCNRDFIEEKFYDMKISGENACRLAESLDDDTLHDITPKIIYDFPNTYTFTKALAENFVRNKSKGLPLTVFRPGIVIATYKEPVAGWIDNVYGPCGLIVAVASGVIRVICAQIDRTAQIVPVDMSVNCLLASAWDVGVNKYEEPPIYNYIPDKDNLIKWSRFIHVGTKLANRYPISRSIWHPCVTITESKLYFLLLTFFYHTIPAIIVDIGLRILGKKARMMQIYRKVHKFMSVLEVFSLREWTFVNENTRNLTAKLTKDDQELFPFDLRTIDWDEMIFRSLIGIRRYVIKEDMDNVDAVIKRYKRMKLLHYVVVYGIYALILFLFYLIMSRYVF